MDSLKFLVAQRCELDGEDSQLGRALVMDIHHSIYIVVIGHKSEIEKYNEQIPMSIVSIWPLLSATTARAGEKAAQEGLAVNAVPANWSLNLG